MSTIKNYLKACCEKFRDNIAFTVKEGSSKRDVSYAELYREVSSLASWLSAYSGERVIVSGKNSYSWALCALSVLCSEAVLVPVDAALPDSEFSRIAARSNAALIIYSEEISEKAEALNIPEKLAMGILSSVMREGTEGSGKKDPNEMSVLMFTSGTTSTSKAVMLSDRNILADINAMHQSHKFYTTDVNLALLPYYHAFGMVSMLLFLSYGMRSVYAKGLRVKAALNEYNVTVFVGVPLILDKIKGTAQSAILKSGKKWLFDAMSSVSGFLLRLGIDIRKLLFSSVRKKIGSLRLVISGAAPLSEDTIKFFDTIGITLIQGYGMTEASPVITAERENDRRLGSVGKPLPGFSVKIDSPGEDGVGEILAKGDNIMLGYMGEENQPFIDGYLKTGDLGFIDDDGFLFIRGRSKNVIVLKNGKNVYPEELEALVGSIIGVNECIAYPSSDSKYVCIKAVYDPEVTDEEAVRSEIAKVNTSVSDYKKMRDITLTTEPFPKTSTGKIKRNEI